LGGLTSRREPEKKSQKVSDSHRNDVSPLTQGLRYRAACDTDAPFNHHLHRLSDSDKLSSRNDKNRDQKAPNSTLFSSDMCRLFADIGEIVADEFRQLTSYTKYSAVGCVLSLLNYSTTLWLVTSKPFNYYKPCHVTCCVDLLSVLIHWCLPSDVLTSMVSVCL